MGPKKDVKPQNTKEVDPTIYIRKVLNLTHEIYSMKSLLNDDDVDDC